MITVIVLKAPACRGKSDTLIELIELLKNDGCRQLLRENAPNGTDVFAIQEWNNVKIGIITQGDPGTEWYVEQCLSKCFTENVDFIVGASRTKYNPHSVYSTLWNFVRDNNLRGVETSTIVKDNNFGIEIDETILNKICAENIKNIIKNLKI